MATNKTTLSVYADDDLLAALNAFKDSGNHKSLNVAIVAILKEKLFGEASDNVQSNVQSTLDAQALIDERLSEIEQRLSKGYTQYATSFNAALSQRDRAIDELKEVIARMEALEPEKNPLALAVKIELEKLEERLFSKTSREGEYLLKDTETEKKASVTGTESSLETEAVPVVNASGGMSRDAAHAIARERGCKATDPKSFSDGFARSEELRYGFTRVKLDPELRKRYKTGGTDKYWYFDSLETHSQ